jgi:broad specificity phosphatase PhoE
MDHRAILITHASIIRAAIVRAIEAAPKSFWRIDITPLSMTRLSGANGRWNLHRLAAVQDDGLAQWTMNRLRSQFLGLNAARWGLHGFHRQRPLLPSPTRRRQA